MDAPKAIAARDTWTMRNKVGTGGRDCPCGGWLLHWKNYTKLQGEPKCGVEGCEVDAEVGAHITLPRHEIEDRQRIEWIVPMCHKHNRSTELLKSKKKAIVVRADTATTCGA